MLDSSYTLLLGLSKKLESESKTPILELRRTLKNVHMAGILDFTKKPGFKSMTMVYIGSSLPLHHIKV